LYLISALALANTESGRFSDIRPNPNSSQICQIWQIAVQLQYVQSITHKINVADQSGGPFAILFSFTPKKKIQNPFQFYKFRQKTGKQ